MKAKNIFLICLLCFLMKANLYAHDFVVDNIYYDILTDSTCEVTYNSITSTYDDYVGDVVIPSTVTYNGKSRKVTSISSLAFRSCQGMISLTVPEYIVSFGQVSQNCYNLTRVVWNAKNFPDIMPFYDVKSQIKEFIIGEGVERIPNSLCRQMSSITSICIPQSVTSVGSGAFEYCTSLSTVIWNAKNCKEYQHENSHYPFGNCENIERVLVGDDVETIPDYFLYRSCTKIKEIKLSESVKSIGVAAFNNSPRSYQLTSLVIPANVTNISQEAFNSCIIDTLSIGKNVRFIGKNAFSKNYPTQSDINILKVYANTPPFIENQFSNIGTSTKILVPAAKMDDYKRSWVSYYSENQGYKYLPLVDADICFYNKATLQDYIVRTEACNLDTITSVAFYDGKDSYLTDRWVRSGMNPNCLYYVYSDETITGENVVNMADLTADNIVLHEGHPFKCPAQFTAKKATYTYTPSTWADGKNGWEAVCLPYEVRNFRASAKGALSPILLGTDGNFWLREFIGASSDELYFTSTYDGVMKAYTPYIVAFPGSKMGKNNIEGQSVSFIGKDVVVGADQPAIVQRNDFIFKGGFDTDADEGTGWILNSNGDGFEKTDVVGNNPFHAYFMTVNDETAAGAKRLSISTEFVEEEGTLVSTVKEAEEELEVVADEGAVIIKANNNTTANIYGANGALLRCVRVNAGENRVEGLAKGLYIINKQKILIR